jgi:predicted hydrocarbon binding protein
MTATPVAATDGLTIGRAALRQLRESLLRDAADHAANILQETGVAAGAGVYQAFCAWLPGQTGVARPEDLDAAQLNDVLSAFFQTTGWGALTVAALGPALTVDSGDWVEAEPGTTEVPMCFFTSGMLSDFLGRLSGETVAVMEVECRSRNDPRCRFLSASPETLTLVYDRMVEGKGYEEALGARG